MVRLVTLVRWAACLIGLAFAVDAAAQALPGVRTMRQDRLERLDANHYRATGAVEIELNDEPTSLSADQVDYFADTRRLVAVGHVVFVSGDGRI